MASLSSVGSGSRGSKPGEFYYPRGIKVHQNQVYVCDYCNDRIQVFDLELLFITSFGTKGSGQGQFDRPEGLHVAFTSQGNIYVSEWANKRVQVLDLNGRYLRQFGNKSGPGKLKEPKAVHIAHECVYVSDNHRIAVFQLSGAFLTSFGKYGQERGKFNYPSGIVFDCNGFLYVCDWLNDRIQVF